MTIAVATALVVYFSSSAGSIRHVGSDMCRNCHESQAAGSVFRKWENGPHAQAYASLESPRSTTYLEHSGTVVASCLPCHSTLGHRQDQPVEQALLTEGVGCERCHGPGSEYSQSIVMRSPGALMRYGGSSGSLNDCGSCHRLEGSDISVGCPIDTARLDVESGWDRIGHTYENLRRDSISLLERARRLEDSLSEKLAPMETDLMDEGDEQE